MISIGAGAIAKIDLFGESIIPRTVKELKRINVPEHDYRSDADFFIISVFPVLKHPCLAFYEGMAPGLEELISKTSQKTLDRGLANDLGSLINEGVTTWDDLISLTLERVTSFKSLTYYSSIVVRQ